MESFIARRLYKSEQGSRKVSRPAVLIAQAGVALGLAVMLVTIAVSFGFKYEVREKAVGFSAHLHISNYESANDYEALPIAPDTALLQMLQETPGVEHVQRYATKAGVLRADGDFLGCVFKGVGEDYDLSFYSNYLKEGELSAFSDSVISNNILISRLIADKLLLEVGDKIDAYFLQGAMRARRYTVTGIYETGFSEYDRLFIVTDLKAVQSLNRWESDQVTGVEVQLADFDKVDDMNWELGSVLDRTEDRYGEQYLVQSVTDINPGLFAWLDVLDMNVWLILALMIGVAAFTMISGLLILIIERTQFIGILKALGASNASVRKSFLYLGMLIIGKGMLWGNVLGLGLVALQYFTQVIPLDASIYYVSYVPMAFPWLGLVGLNIGVLLVSWVIMLAPSAIVSQISPAKVMHFE